MDSKCMTTSSSSTSYSIIPIDPKRNHININTNTKQSCHWNWHQSPRRAHQNIYQQLQQKQSSYSKMVHKLRRQRQGSCILQTTLKQPIKDEEQPKKKKKKKKGSVGGAIALVIGTSIGSGILALPNKASPAGLVPSSISMVVCWGFLLIEALLLVEINVSIRKRKKKNKKKKEENEMNDELDLEVISIKTMAQESLGDWGANVVSVIYIFLGYTSVIAYSSKSGDILFHLISLPPPISAFVFTLIFTLLISLGGTRATDQVNQLLTSSMIGLLLAIEVVAVICGGAGGWSSSGLLDSESGDWSKVPATIPVIIFSLVYHDLAPVLCAYLGNDLRRLRISVFVGSVVPLLALLVWDAIALGLSSQTHHDQFVDPVELLLRVKWSGVSYMVEAFSLLAVGTSLIGTLLGFSEFFKEQLTSNNTSRAPKRTQTLQKKNISNMLLFGELRQWWGANKIRLTAMTMVVGPSLVVSSSIPDTFSTATDIAGGYCMTLLYGVVPPAMAWAMYNKKEKLSEIVSGDTDNEKMMSLSRARPVVVGAGLLACAIVAEQILQDINLL